MKTITLSAPSLFLSYYSEIMVTIISVSTPFREVISGGQPENILRYKGKHYACKVSETLKRNKTKHTSSILNNAFCLL